MINKSNLIADKFVFQLHKTDASLIIEADDQTTSLEFIRELRNDIIPDLTNQIFVDIDDLYTGLLGAIQRSNQETKVCMSRDGKLTFSHKTLIGKREKVFSFSIVLEEKTIDTKDKLERQVTKISSRQVEIQEKFEELSARTKKLEELLMERVYFEKTMLRKFDELNNTIRRLEQITTERFNDYDSQFQQIQKDVSLIVGEDGSKKSFRFDRSGVNHEQYDFSNGDKTITKRVYGHAPIFATSILPPTEKQEFVVKIGKHLQKSPFLIGIASSKYRSSHEPCYHVQGTCFFNYNGEVYQVFNNGPFTKLSKAPQTIEGLVVSVIVDFDNNKVSFKTNGEEVVKVNFNLSNLKEIGVYPCIDIISPNDCISFI